MQINSCAKNRKSQSPCTICLSDTKKKAHTIDIYKVAHNSAFINFNEGHPRFKVFKQFLHQTLLDIFTGSMRLRRLACQDWALRGNYWNNLQISKVKTRHACDWHNIPTTFCSKIYPSPMLTNSPKKVLNVSYQQHQVSCVHGMASTIYTISYCFSQLLSTCAQLQAHISVLQCTPMHGISMLVTKSRKTPAQLKR